MNFQKGSVGSRFAAAFIDSLLIGLIAGVLYSVDRTFGMVSWPVFTILYYGLFEGGSMMATPGKKAMGLAVVDAEGRGLTSANAFIRALGRVLSEIILGIGFFMGLGESGLCLHDRMAGSFVVTAASLSGGQPKPPRPASPSPAVSPKVLCVIGTQAGREFPVSGEGLIIGSNSAACGIALPGQPGVSRIHCRVRYNAASGSFVLEDLGSSYGTYLADGQKVRKGQPVALANGDEFYLAVPKNRYRVIL